MANKPLKGADVMPPKGAAAKIRKWASEATGKRAIAQRFGIGHKRLEAWFEEFPELQAAWDEGVEEEHGMLYQALLKHLDKSPVPAIFLLKTRHGYREGDQTEIANRVSVTFTLPAAAPLEEFKQARVIEPSRNALETHGTGD